MLAQTQTAVLSPLRFLLNAGGLPLLAFGLVFGIWGVMNFVRPRSSGHILAQCLLSLIPGIIAMVAVYVACCDFTELATAETAPKPAEIAKVTGYSMSIAFFGLASTIVPVAIGLCALGKFSRLVQPEYGKEVN